jgi:hypothetical protein
LAKLLGLKDCEEAFSAALLQDMAVPLLAKELPKEYLELLEARQALGRRLSDLERERFGWTHAEAAAAMARGWKMPDDFGALLENHTKIDELLATGKARPDQIAVAVSALLPSISDERWAECAHFETVFNKVRPSNGPAAQEVLAQVDQEFAEFAPVLKLTTPAKSLVAWYEESLAATA